MLPGTTGSALCLLLVQNSGLCMQLRTERSLTGHTQLATQQYVFRSMSAHVVGGMSALPHCIRKDSKQDKVHTAQPLSHYNSLTSTYEYSNPDPHPPELGLSGPTAAHQKPNPDVWVSWTADGADLSWTPLPSFASSLTHIWPCALAEQPALHIKQCVSMFHFRLTDLLLSCMSTPVSRTKDSCASQFLDLWWVLATFFRTMIVTVIEDGEEAL